MAPGGSAVRARFRRRKRCLLECLDPVPNDFTMARRFKPAIRMFICRFAG